MIAHGYALALNAYPAPLQLLLQVMPLGAAAHEPFITATLSRMLTVFKRGPADKRSCSFLEFSHIPTVCQHGVRSCGQATALQQQLDLFELTGLPSPGLMVAPGLLMTGWLAILE